MGPVLIAYVNKRSSSLNASGAAGVSRTAALVRVRTPALYFSAVGKGSCFRVEATRFV